MGQVSYVFPPQPFFDTPGRKMNPVSLGLEEIPKYTFPVLQLWPKQGPDLSPSFPVLQFCSAQNSRLLKKQHQKHDKS